jgi:hypothetical protein
MGVTRAGTQELRGADGVRDEHGARHGRRGAPKTRGPRKRREREEALNLLASADLEAIRDRVLDEVRARPGVALAAAFGAGVAVSHVLTSRVARVALVAGAGDAAKELIGPRLLDVIRQEGEALFALDDDAPEE